jgi:hypothetical protein
MCYSHRRQISTKEEERAVLEAQLRRDRGEFASQAKLLSQHFAAAQNKTAALQVAHEALQVRTMLQRFIR